MALQGEASRSTGDGNHLAEIELGLIAEPAQENIYNEVGEGPQPALGLQIYRVRRERRRRAW